MTNYIYYSLAFFHKYFNISRDPKVSYKNKVGQIITEVLPAINFLVTLFILIQKIM